MIINSKEVCVCSIFGEYLMDFYNNENKKNLYIEIVIDKIERMLIWCIKNGINYFKIGLHEGIELICIELLLDLKKQYRDVLVECVLFKSCYMSKNKNRIKKILNQVNSITKIKCEKKKYNIEDYINYMFKNSSYILILCGLDYVGFKNVVEEACLYKIKTLISPLY